MHLQGRTPRPRSCLVLLQERACGTQQPGQKAPGYTATLILLQEGAAVPKPGSPEARMGTGSCTSPDLQEHFLQGSNPGNSSFATHSPWGPAGHRLLYGKRNPALPHWETAPVCTQLNQFPLQEENRMGSIGQGICKLGRLLCIKIGPVTSPATPTRSIWCLQGLCSNQPTP